MRATGDCSASFSSTPPSITHPALCSTSARVSASETLSTLTVSYLTLLIHVDRHPTEKMSCTGFSSTVVYSVCGHSMFEKVVEGQENVSGHISFGSRIPLPQGFECRAGWCPKCSDHYRPEDINNAAVIDNYWRFKAQQRWVHPVDLDQVPRSALFCHHATTLVRSAMVDVSACIDSLFGQVHSRHSEEIVFLHRSGPKYIEAANIIRNSTFAWARRLEYLNKPLPASPRPISPEHHHEPTAPAPNATSKRGRKGKPTPLLSLDEPRQRLLTFTDDEGDQFWIPGAHRTPTHMTSQSAPPRPAQILSFCGYHGRVDASSVDMSCHRCRMIFLDESHISPRSRLSECRSAPAFPSELYACAAEGRCSCKVSAQKVCSPCRARAQVSERRELEYGFF